MRNFDYTSGETRHDARRDLVGPGETAIAHAPVLRLDGNELCIPQHFLRYEHSRETVEAITAKITYDPRYPIFVSGDAGGLYIQIGIVGPDNYKQSAEKLVYGRKWRVEPNLPTSEIIQTVFLALKKAREHELRERFVWLSEGRRTTPFNGHQDLPHMARNAQCYVGHAQPAAPEDIIEAVIYDGLRFSVSNVVELPTAQVVLTLTPKTEGNGEFARLCQHGLTFIADSLSPSDILHGLFEACLKTSDSHVENQFSYGGFNRFSRDVNIFAIATLSSKQRQCPTRYLPEEEAHEFIGTLTSENYETDATRIPSLSNTAHNRALCKQLTKMQVSPPPIA